MHERRFNREIERLREPERIARLEITRVVNLSLDRLKQPSTVLDVGTGSGLFAEQFVIKGLSVTGLDANPDMLQFAQKYVPSGIFKEGTAENLPFADESFDLVFMGLLLHEADDSLAALRESYRVVRQRLAVLEWRDEEQSLGPPEEHRIPVNKIKQMAKQAGFNKFRYVKLTNLALYLINK